MEIKSINNENLYTNNIKKYSQTNLLQEFPHKYDEVSVCKDSAQELNNQGFGINLNHLFYQIGRIFEKSEEYDTALNFYEAVFKNLKDSQRKEKHDIIFDINRVKEKSKAQLNAKEWNV